MLLETIFLIKTRFIANICSLLITMNTNIRMTSLLMERTGHDGNNWNWHVPSHDLGETARWRQSIYISFYQDQMNYREDDPFGLCYPHCLPMVPSRSSLLPLPPGGISVFKRSMARANPSINPLLNSSPFMPSISASISGGISGGTIE